MHTGASAGDRALTSDDVSRALHEILDLRRDFDYSSSEVLQRKRLRQFGDGPRRRGTGLGVGSRPFAERDGNACAKATSHPVVASCS